MRDYRSPFEVPRHLDVDAESGMPPVQWARNRERFAQTGDELHLERALQYVTPDCPPLARKSHMPDRTYPIPDQRYVAEALRRLDRKPQVRPGDVRQVNWPRLAWAVTLILWALVLLVTGVLALAMAAAHG
jgi:hypothetical protein